MKLEGVIICCGYADFLAQTLPENKNFFDYLVVVTDTKDQATKDLCEFHHVHCVQTDVFYENGDPFNKGKGINEGLKILKKDGWVLQLDADIYLPPLTKMILNNCDKNGGFDPKAIYGTDRMMCQSYDEWIKFKANPFLTHQGWIYVYTTVFPMGVRIAKFHTSDYTTGYLPIGFFQMWNPKGSGVYIYPDEHGNADRTDLLMAQKFTKGFRHLIPEIVPIHLESEPLSVAQMGANWNGRKTRIFGPEGSTGLKGDNGKPGKPTIKLEGLDITDPANAELIDKINKNFDEIIAMTYDVKEDIKPTGYKPCNQKWLICRLICQIYHACKKNKKS